MQVALGNDCDKVVNDLLDTHKDFKSNKKVEVCLCNVKKGTCTL